MNKVILIGNLTRDPEYTSGNNYTMAKFCIAVQRDKDNVDFLDIVAWNNTADLCNRYLAKGRKVAIEGRVQVNTYKNKDDKTIKYYDIHAQRVEFLGGAEEKQEQKPALNLNSLPEVDDGEVPF